MLPNLQDSFWAVQSLLLTRLISRQHCCLAAALLWCSVLLAPAAGVRFPRFSTVSAGRAQNILPPTCRRVPPRNYRVRFRGCSVTISGSPRNTVLSSLDSFAAAFSSYPGYGVAERGVDLACCQCHDCLPWIQGMRNTRARGYSVRGYGISGDKVLRCNVLFSMLFSRFESYQIRERSGLTWIDPQINQSVGFVDFSHLSNHP